MLGLAGESLNLTEYNLQKMKELFPEVFEEGKIDFDKLRLILGDEVEDNEERYEFTWHGKNNAIRIAQTPSTGTLIPDKESSKNWDDTENLYIEGDNLEVLKLLQKSYFGKVKVIYIDPPYNTGKDFVYHDNFRDNIANYKEITNQTTKANPETNGRYHTDWLNMIYPRLKLARNLLSQDGVIFINIGQEELDNTTKIVKEIFGGNNYISCISRVTKKTSNSGTFFAPSIDYIIVACKSIDCVKYFKSDLTDEQKKSFKLNDSRGSYKLVGFYQASLELERSRNARYYIECPDGSKCIPKENKRWRTVKETYDDFLRNDMIVFKKTKNSPLIDENGEQSIWNIYTKSYANSRIEMGNVPREYIDKYCNNMGTLCLNELNIPFDFSKPKELVQYLIKICNMDNEGIVLDFFSGSSTTAHATIDLNKDKKTNWKFIMVQLPELTEEKSEAHKAGYKNICEIGKERIRRAGDKIVSENKDKEGIENLDIGFKVFKLDSSNLKSWDSSMDNLEQNLLDMESNLKKDRTNEDLLYEILLKSGIELTAKIEEIKVGYNTLYNIGQGALLACLDDKITQDVIDEIPKHRSPFMDTKVIFKEAGFMSDAAKINAVQNLKQFKIEDVRSV